MFHAHTDTSLIWALTYVQSYLYPQDDVFLIQLLMVLAYIVGVLNLTLNENPEAE